MSWIDIRKSVERPEDGSEVIAYAPRDGIEYRAYYAIYNGESVWQRNGRCNMEGVTHYRPKLQPPS